MASSIGTPSFIQDTGIVSFEGVQLSVILLLNCRDTNDGTMANCGTKTTQTIHKHTS